jgi:hypothetical protein
MKGVYLFVDAYVIFSLLHSPNHEMPTPARTKVNRPQKPVHIPKSFMVDAIKVHLTKLLGTPSLDVKEEKL